ncbi:MAG: carboxypeptidase-like regulatory domain-containing protein [Chloroflexota bacterium]
MMNYSLSWRPDQHAAGDYTRKGCTIMRSVRNFSIRTGVLLGAMILACAFAYVMPAHAAPLGQAGTGTITGQVLSLDNVALPNVRLAAFVQAPGTPDRTTLSEFQSDAQGRYSVQVPVGQVWLEFQTQDINGQSFWGYSNLPVNVAAGETVSGQDFRVAIRVVSEPPPAVSPPAVSPAPGMPRTGAGPNQWLPLVGGFGVLLLMFGLVQRRRASR